VNIRRNEKLKIKYKTEAMMLSISCFYTLNKKATDYHNYAFNSVSYDTNIAKLKNDGFIYLNLKFKKI